MCSRSPSKATTAAPRRAARRTSKYLSRPSSGKSVQDATGAALIAPGVARSARVDSRANRATQVPTSTAESAPLSRSPRYGGGLRDEGFQGEELSAEECCPGEGSSGESAGFDFGEANSAASGSQEDASDTVCVDCNQKGHPSQADPQCEHFEETW